MPNPTRRPEVFIFEGEAKSVLPAAESFTRQGLRVVVGSSHRYCFGFYSRWCRERILIPDQRLEPHACADFLLNLVRRRRFEMLLPLGDEATEIVCQHRDEFLKHTRLVLVPQETFMMGRDKVRTMKAAEACGVPVPRSFCPEEQSLDEIARQAQFPLLVKPAVSSGARGIYYVRNAGEMARRYQEVSSTYGRTFLQELIPHDGMQYKTELLLDPQGNVLASFAYAKIRYYPPHAGSSTLNLSVYHPEMVENAVRLARHIGWFGICDFDFIHDVRDNRIKLMEINPRVTDTIRIAQVCGIDFFRMMYDMARGREIQPVTTYRTGVYMRFLPGEVMWFLTARGKRFKTTPGFFSTFFMRTEHAIATWRDPGPMIAYLLETLGALLSPEQRAYRFRLR